MAGAAAQRVVAACFARADMLSYIHSVEAEEYPLERPQRAGAGASPVAEMRGRAL